MFGRHRTGDCLGVNVFWDLYTFQLSTRRKDYIVSDKFFFIPLTLENKMCCLGHELQPVPLKSNNSPQAEVYTEVYLTT